MRPPPAEVKLVIPPEVRGFLASTIARAGGNEVYFLAKVAWDSPVEARVDEVDILARGNAAAAPAIIRRAEDWDIAIHNHPSGSLEPSDADLAVAAELGNRSVGCAIIDNRAERHYLVVPPFRRAEVPRLDPDEVAAIFAPGGPIAAALDGHEERPGQVSMAREVAAALAEDRVVAIEAGTGVGKSFAYLVPAILWSVRTKKRVIVSTNTINLQEQLIGKDLPFLEKVLPVKFRYALIKGRGNYACKRKVAELAESPAALLVESPDEERQLRDIIAWARAAREGSRSELGAEPSERVWEMISSETDKSLKVNCRFYGECFYYQAKRAAFAADIVVVNHHLFFADLAVRKETGNYEWDLVIPGYERVVFDEAHHLEDVASQYLGVRLSQLGLRRRFSRLCSRKKDVEKGVLPHLAVALRKEGAPIAAESIESGLLPAVREAAPRIEEEMKALTGAVEEAARAGGGARDGGGAAGGRVGRPRGGGAEPAGDDGAEGSAAPEGESQVRLTPAPEQAALRAAVEKGLRAVLDELLRVIRHGARAIEALEASLTLPEERRASMLLELRSTGSRLESVCGDIERFLDFEDRAHVRWAEVRGRRNDPDRRGVTFASAPIRVDGELKAAVYDPLRTVVLTSATLSVEGTVDFLGDRLGFALVPGDRFRFSEHPSPFDYARQALTLVTDDLPEPGSRDYGGRVAAVVLDVLLRTRGRAFVLFTSYGLLRRTFEAVRAPLAAEGIRAVRQGEAGRTELLRRFRSGPPHALFGTDSFWEGVDVKGEALECVVITRLPFRVPTEPIQVARIEDLRERGRDPFGSFTVPQAVLKFKQGFGRLIRSSTDRGVVVVLDRRTVTRPYGRAFLRSLPPARIRRGPAADLLLELEGFFTGRGGDRTISP